jgi:sporulation protein YlmC with PRC-barrel domain
MAQLPSQSQFGDYGEWPGRDVLDSGGERLGGVREIYLDRETGRPEWVLVDVDSDEARFVPLADASVESSTIRVAHSAAAIRSAPGIGAEPRIDQSEERRLYAHYGLGYSETDSGSGLPTDEPPSAPEQRASGPTPTAWGAPDAASEERSTPTGWGESKAADPTSPWGTEEDRPAPFSAGEQAGGTETPDPWATPAKAEAPTDPWGKPKAAEPTPPWRADTEEPATSWSEAAEPTNLAPDPAEPPSVEELEAADIPEPSIVADVTPAPEAVAADPAPDEEPVPVAPAEADLTAQHGPDSVRAVPEPPRIHSVPPPPPPPEEPSSGALSVIGERKTTIAAGVGIALILLFVLRRLR